METLKQPTTFADKIAKEFLIKPKKTRRSNDIIAVLILGAALAFGWYFKDFIAKDRCLDKKGCWDEVDNMCRKDEPNAYQLCSRHNE